MRWSKPCAAYTFCCKTQKALSSWCREWGMPTQWPLLLHLNMPVHLRGIDQVSMALVAAYGASASRFLQRHSLKLHSTNVSVAQAGVVRDAFVLGYMNIYTVFLSKLLISMHSGINRFYKKIKQGSHKNGECKHCKGALAHVSMLTRINIL